MNEAELILTSLLDCPRHELYLKGGLLNAKHYARLKDVLKLRSAGLPLQYILGSSEFMGLKIMVREGVFIPRPETEILVETAIKIATGCKLQAASLNILDIGTGSGCIAVSLAKFLPEAEVIAIDISLEAINIAQENAELNNVAGRIKFLQSDFFACCLLPVACCDIIVSNPPYISSDEIKKLPKEVQYEPMIALDGGCDGLDFYRKVIKDSPRHLRENGYLIMEMGDNQKEAIGNIAKQSGNFMVSETIKDYNLIERIIVLKFK
ncbi:MAG: peptide chain release factor N(5)-glutamine methyltransferase [Candidatus Omnitrophota bacterium]|nr:peptide chain release factor N(5)-glutamine methyltransferase [Candidatus Omnitrophota bacterium]